MNIILTLLVTALSTTLVTQPRQETYVATEKRSNIVYAEEIKSVATTTPERTFDSEIKRLAEKYGQDENLARKIIKCESSIYAHATGTLAVVGKDIGYWQINSHFHEETAKAKGYDIYKWEDNLEYGFALLKDQGTQPWKASKHCWGKGE